MFVNTLFMARGPVQVWLPSPLFFKRQLARTAALLLHSSLCTLACPVLSSPPLPLLFTPWLSCPPPQIHPPLPAIFSQRSFAPFFHPPFPGPDTLVTAWQQPSSWPRFPPYPLVSSPSQQRALWLETRPALRFVCWACGRVKPSFSPCPAAPGPQLPHPTQTQSAGDCTCLSVTHLLTPRLPTNQLEKKERCPLVASSVSNLCSLLPSTPSTPAYTVVASLFPQPLRAPPPGGWSLYS